MQIVNYTNQLKIELDRLKELFNQGNPPTDRRDKDFFEMVKNNTDPIYELLAKWEELALSIIKESKISVHPNQIVSTRENMELLLMHSYYIDVRRRRYMELYKSVLYVFDQLLRAVEDMN
ncbi:YppE family protein [Ornithinibacillus halotolerans]|uniref:DUF1798 family protein n=1 Tax=Ornithinibacillus halotolerans TaxID=1274357 RepID=A0A916RLY9_9BACI|nr:YppE family protein [Ornithinibacillus halotolerans]GGA61577.1 hypothetical protein GCM10008025_01930 [Ornithinibacillus halotolerans]